MPPPKKIAIMDKILVVGANGVLGQNIIRLLGPDLAVAGTRRRDWDSGDFAQISVANVEALNGINWRTFRAVINVAGRVHGGKHELRDANVHFPVALALAARAGKVPQFIQVSSFSVYGYASYIDSNTIEAPANDYGHTKAVGDQQLHALGTEHFQVASLRLPFLFDADRPSLFGPLFRAIKLTSYLPTISEPTLRSMMSYADAARILTAMVEDCRSGIFHAAAPTLFDLKLLRQLLLEESGYLLRTIGVPNAVAKIVNFVVPTLHRRLFQSSVLCPRLNIAMGLAETIDLEIPLRELIRRHF